MRHVLLFILVVVFCQAYAQHAETTEPAQSGVVKDIQYVPALAGRQEKGGELQDKVFTRIDSLSGKSTNLLQTTTDSLSNLSSVIEGEVQSNPPSLKSFGGRVDSLQQRLNEIQAKGNQQLSNATEKADKLTRRIDSLQN